MRRTRTTVPLSLAAVALVGATLPVGGAYAEQPPPFSGYTAGSWAAPVKIEIYEPTIPIPATPQAELEIGYTTTEATSGLLKARASFLWPGDPVGSGFRTFGEALGLPEEVYGNGYPVQVNAVHPSGPEEEAQEPFPGTMMRSRATGEAAEAAVGWSSDSQPPADPEDSQGGEDGDGGEGGPPGLPELPALPGGIPNLTDPAQFGAVITGSTGQSAADEPASSPLPPELAMLVDVSGVSSTSRTAPGADAVDSRSWSAIAEASLLGGVVVFENLSARARTVSDGSSSKATGRSRVGSVTIAGQTFEVGSDGIRAGGQEAPIPGLPDDPDKALAQLGLSVTRPGADLTAKGLDATGLTQAVRIEIDMTTLRQNLSDIPLGDVVGALPPNELTNVVTAVANLSPRIVITLGNAAAESSTVTALVPPALPQVPAAQPDAGTGGGGAGGAAGGTGSSGTGDSGTATPGAAGGEEAPVAAADDGLEDVALASGLPALTTVPGALTMGGILLAIAAGTWLRRIGVLALGGLGSCPHGLDSGLPDLRKA